MQGEPAPRELITDGMKFRHTFHHLEYQGHVGLAVAEQLLNEKLTEYFSVVEVQPGAAGGAPVTRAAVSFSKRPNWRDLDKWDITTSDGSVMRPSIIKRDGSTEAIGLAQFEPIAKSHSEFWARPTGFPNGCPAGGDAEQLAIYEAAVAEMERAFPKAQHLRQQLPPQAEERLRTVQAQFEAGNVAGAYAAGGYGRGAVVQAVAMVAMQRDASGHRPRDGRTRPAAGSRRQRRSAAAAGNAAGP